MRIKLEYDGTNYKTESSIPISQASNFNFGIVFPQSKNLSYKLNFTRGNTVNFGFSYKLNLGNKNAQTASKEKQSRISNSNAIKIVTSRSDQNLFKGALKYLSDEKIFLQHASINNNELEVILLKLNIEILLLLLEEHSISWIKLLQIILLVLKLAR